MKPMTGVEIESRKNAQLCFAAGVLAGISMREDVPEDLRNLAKQVHGDFQKFKEEGGLDDMQFNRLKFADLAADLFKVKIPVVGEVK